MLFLRRRRSTVGYKWGGAAAEHSSQTIRQNMETVSSPSVTWLLMDVLSWTIVVASCDWLAVVVLCAKTDYSGECDEAMLYSAT